MKYQLEIKNVYINLTYYTLLLLSLKIIKELKKGRYLEIQ
jgi:hypothetical protein